MNVCFGSEADPLAGGYTARCFSLRADTLATDRTAIRRGARIKLA
jgi:hypothetical protein